MKIYDIEKKYKSLTPEAVSEVSALLQKDIDRDNRKIIVLDDDPTGTQTVHGISVYTKWDKESIEAGFKEENNMFYILTNSRAMSRHKTEKVHREIADTICETAKKYKKEFLVISRSDSTLRGHYPLETSILRNTLEKNGFTVDGEILCPFFLEGGRVTADNIHYVIENGDAVPASETEFAQDGTFGYRHSNLCEYIEEKTEGKYPASEVKVISLDCIREMDIDAIESILVSARDFQKIVVNALCYDDLKVFCLALYNAMAKGKNFLFRSAASLVKTVSGIAKRPLLGEADFHKTNGGGLVVAGSYTNKTTAQLNEASTVDTVCPVVFDSNLVIEPKQFEKEIECVTGEAAEIIAQHKIAMIYTCRQRLQVEGDTKESLLQRSVAISDGLQRIVKNILTVYNSKPGFIIAKGGITSSDIATKGINIKRADVLGQIEPGIPVWKCGPESYCPGTPLVIFPGNVGGSGTLKDIIKTMR